MRIKGFTLIELMVAISIVAILSAIGLTLFTSVQKSARDAKRKSDLHAISLALEQYYLANGSYPVTDWVYSNNGSWIPGLDTNYMAAVPTDPKSNGGQPWAGTGTQYGYAYWSAPGGCASYPEGKFYVLITQLENKQDSQRNGITDVKWCDGNGLTSYHGWSGTSYIVEGRQ